MLIHRQEYKVSESILSGIVLALLVLIYGDNKLEIFPELVSSGSKVALVASHNTWIYNFLLRNPDLEFTPMKQLVLDSSSQALPYDYILCLKDLVEVKWDLNNKVLNASEVLWGSEPGRKEAKLIRILPEKSIYEKGEVHSVKTF